MLVASSAKAAEHRRTPKRGHTLSAQGGATAALSIFRETRCRILTHSSAEFSRG
jgi:hypothetical protein